VEQTELQRGRLDAHVNDRVELQRQGIVAGARSAAERAAYAVSAVLGRRV
jgi:hypothetical protein